MSATSDLSHAKRELFAKYVREGRGGHLKQALQGQDQRRFLGTGVTPIHMAGTNLPVFFLHGDYTSTEIKHWFLCLGEELGADQPFYALDPARLDAPVAPTLEEFVGAHLEVVRTIQPRGPYVLGGSCNGGLMAFEMARQLQRDGETASLLILVEPFVVTPSHRVWRRFICYLGGLLKVGPDKQLNWFLATLPILEYLLTRHRYLRNRLMLQDRRRYGHLSHVVAREFKRGISQFGRLARMSREDGPADAPMPPRRPLEDYPAIFRWMAAGYSLRRYVGTVAMYWTADKFEEEPSAPVRWLGLAEGAEIHVVPGMVTPGGSQHASAVAAHWRALLGRTAAHAQTPEC